METKFHEITPPTSDFLICRLVFRPFRFDVSLRLWLHDSVSEVFDHTYPNLRKGIRWCCLAGGLFAFLWLGLCGWLATTEPETGYCLRYGDSWWTLANWLALSKSAVTIFLYTGIPSGIMAAFRPEFSTPAR